MSIEQQIKTALEPLGYKVYPGNYDGTDDIYFVIGLDTIPADFGDNVPQHERVLGDVHLFCPYDFNSVTLRKDVKKALLCAGFTYPSMTNASDAEGQHWVFETETVEGVSNGEV